MNRVEHRTIGDSAFEREGCNAIISPSVQQTCTLNNILRGSFTFKSSKPRDTEFYVPFLSILQFY